jgi:hypothetical protein
VFITILTTHLGHLAEEPGSCDDGKRARGSAAVIDDSQDIVDRHGEIRTVEDL